MTREMGLRIADWHGEQAAKSYREWLIHKRSSDVARFIYHTQKADKMWRMHK